MKKVLQAKGSVMIVEQKREDVTDSGIILSKESLEGGSMEQYEGTILAVGPLVSKFKKGDYISWGKNSMSVKTWYGKEYILLFEHAITTTEIEVKDDHVPSDDEVFIPEEVKS